MIFYFSATGNSQFVAEKTAAALGERVISIGVALRDGHFDYDVSGDSYIGFVIPTFAWTIPGAVAQFIEKMKLTGAEGKFAFGIITAGAGTGGAPAALRAALEEKGIAYSASYDLAMIDNYIVWSSIPSDAAVRSKLDAISKKVDAIIAELQNKTAGRIPSDAPRDKFMPFTPVDSAAGNCQFTCSDACTGCGTCAELCPMSCITMQNSRPVWKGDCTVCFACMHRCPSEAIDFGRETAGKRRYSHPDVKPRMKNEYN